MAMAMMFMNIVFSLWLIMNSVGTRVFIFTMMITGNIVLNMTLKQHTPLDEKRAPLGLFELLEGHSGLLRSCAMVSAGTSLLSRYGCSASRFCARVASGGSASSAGMSFMK